MSKNDNTQTDDLFSSLISDIKNYTGKDPLLPWICGIKKMKESLPPQLLKDKLPRFLQKCSQTFLSDRRYSNDMRYLRVWLQLMDFVDDPKSVLQTMEMNRIGIQKALFYQAYALYYEKIKKFESAEKMYHLGVQNLAEPIDELQKSYEQFINRMERHKNKKIQRQGMIGKKKPLNEKKQSKKEVSMDDQDDTVVSRFVDTALIGKSSVEDARHHGLVEPTINTKEAMNAINSMFQQPLEPSLATKRNRAHLKTDQSVNTGFNVYVDEVHNNQTSQPSQTSQPEFQIYIDDEENDDVSEEKEGQMRNFVFPTPVDHVQLEAPPQRRFVEDTAVYRFVGSTISDEPEVENVCHHGLVDPTINLKEAMDDINNMFGKPIEFARKSRLRKEEKPPVAANKSISGGGFMILPDEVVHTQQASSSVKRGGDLFEQTICTKEAMDEINSMFNMPLDF